MRSYKKYILYMIQIFIKNLKLIYIYIFLSLYQVIYYFVVKFVIILFYLDIILLS